MEILDFFILLSTVLIYFLYKTYKLKNIYQKNWRKWESEYWLLRGSVAVDNEKYDVHLSWLPRGEENCITVKKEIE